jgi:PAS domain S-box-containing protein
MTDDTEERFRDAPGGQQRASAWRITVAAVLAVIIFVIDTIAPTGYTVSVLYLLPLYIVLQIPGRRFFYAALAVVAACAFAAIPLKPRFAPLYVSFFNRVVTLLLGYLIGSLVTRRNVLEAETRQSERRYLTLFNTRTNGIVHWLAITDRQGRPVDLKCLKVNSAFEKIINRKKEEVEGRPLTQIFPGVEHAPQDYIGKYGGIAINGGEISWEDYFEPTDTWVLNYAYSPMPGEVTVIFSDITGRKKAEAALRESEYRLNAIFDNITEGLIVVDPTGSVLKWNPAALRMHGYERHGSELDFLSQTRSFFDIATPDGAPVPFDRWPIPRISRGENIRDLELCVHSRRQGWRRIFNYNGALIRGENDAIVMGLLTIRDVTERRRAEEALRRREAELRAVTDNSPDVIARLDRGLRHTFINPYGEKVYGRPRGEIIGKTNAEIGVPEPQVTVLKRHFEEVFATGKQQNVEFGFDSPAFGHQHFLSVFVPERDERGEIASILAITRDITQLKQVQERLSDAVQETRRRAEEAEKGRRILEALMDNIPEGIIVTDAEGRILSISNYLARISGHDQREITGKNYRLVDELLNEPSRLLDRRHGARARRTGAVGAAAIAETPLAVEYPLERALSTGVVTPGEEHQVYLPGGTVHTVVINAAPVYAGGRIAGAVSSWRDITDRKKAEDAMQASNRELEQFAYVASHDLQEPLRMIASFTELLERRYRDLFDERGRKYLAYIVDGAGRMQALIQDLLTFSRIGRLDTGRERIELDAVVDTVIGDLAGKIRETGAAVTHDPLPALHANASGIGRVFMNLIGNALKFRKPGVAPRVHIAARHSGREWQFAVRDNGIGIDPKYYGKIFVIFQRLHSREEYPGTGMGLAIVKKIVENHGGRIWVESAPGAGATFYFTLPQ